MSVTGDTKVFTDFGETPIYQLDGQQVNVWNGKQWVKVEIKEKDRNCIVQEIEFSNGSRLKCTQDSIFIMKDDSKKKLKDLKVGDRLCSWKTPHGNTSDYNIFEHIFISSLFPAELTEIVYSFKGIGIFNKILMEAI